eukprot:745897-Hanusia_phi.AAC.6
MSRRAGFGWHRLSLRGGAEDETMDDLSGSSDDPYFKEYLNASEFGHERANSIFHAVNYGKNGEYLDGALKVVSARELRILELVRHLVIYCNKEEAERVWAKAKRLKMWKAHLSHPPMDPNITAYMENSKIALRTQVRQAALQGNLTACRLLVDEHLGIEFWSTHPELLLRVVLQQFIELVRDGELSDALSYAQKHVSFFAECNPGYLPQIEDVMSVLTVQQSNAQNNPAQELLDPSRRELLFLEINGAILRFLGLESDSEFDRQEKLKEFIALWREESGKSLPEEDDEYMMVLFRTIAGGSSCEFKGGDLGVLLGEQEREQDADLQPVW